MCKNNKISISEKGENTKKGCSGDCKQCPFDKTFTPPQENTHKGLPIITESVKNIIENTHT